MIIRKVILVSLSLFLFFHVSYCQYNLSHNEAWLADLTIYQSSLEKNHIDLYHSINKDAFDREIQKIIANIPVKSDMEITTDLMCLTRRINDGHTSVSLKNMSTHQFPLEIKLIEDQWCVVKISKEHKNLLNLSLSAIDDVPIAEVSNKISEVAQFVENKYSQVVRTGSYLNISELLYALQIIKKDREAVFTFIDLNNQEKRITLKALDNESLNQTSDFVYLTYGVPEIKKPNNPMFQYLWFTSINNTQALYLNFESYPTFDDMQVFGEAIVDYISKNQIKQLVVDMRNNGGGDLYVGMVLAYALNLADSIDWKNGVFVLTSNKTFSAGTSNAALFKQLLNAKIVGQPTGSNPNGYQDMDSFTLPNSKLVITYSKRLFRLSPQVNTSLQPDIIINQNRDDLFKGTDSILKELIKGL